MIKTLGLAVRYYEETLKRLLILEEEDAKIGRKLGAGSMARGILLSRYRYALRVIEKTLRLTEGEKERARRKILRAIAHRA